MWASQQALMAISIPKVYATLNPSDKDANISLSSWNLVATAANTSWKSARANQGKSSWKHYWEIVVTSPWAFNSMVWVWSISDALNNFVWFNSTGWSYYSYTGKWDASNAYNNNSNIPYGTPYTLGDVIWVALDATGGTLEFFKNNVSQGSLSIWAGTWYPMVSPYDNGVVITANFGATPLTYTPPAWFNDWLYN